MFYICNFLFATQCLLWRWPFMGKHIWTPKSSKISCHPGSLYDYVVHWYQNYVVQVSFREMFLYSYSIYISCLWSYGRIYARKGSNRLTSVVVYLDCDELRWWYICFSNHLIWSVVIFREISSAILNYADWSTKANRDRRWPNRLALKLVFRRWGQPWFRWYINLLRLNATYIRQ